MPRMSMLPTVLRETFCTRSLPREPEPSLVMDNQEQVHAYAEAGRINGVMAAAYLFHTARITQTIQDCKTVVDLGCGPATQLAQIAQFNPDIQFIGIELSSEMLEMAREYCDAIGVDNIDFIQGNMTKLEHFENSSIDGVISTMALHHLPTIEHLSLTFYEIKRILKPDGALYLVDFGRLKSLKSVIYFAYMNARYQPHIFSLDFERSLRAAFLREEFEELVRNILDKEYVVLSTYFMPVLVLVKSRDKGELSPTQREKLLSMKNALPKKYKSDLDDIRLLFRLGGLGNDTF